ncbi:acid-sensing ion channel 1-like [Asterias amurensis]|uniref:acid-sensing ion channel 1-like n=1 Tax=Asterias amurensis TaxID=7602 RepID=UPI003AB747DD
MEDPKQASLEFEFATTTTLHAIGHVAESRGIWGKAPWVIVLLVASGFYAAVTFDRISAYLRYEASTNVMVDFMPKLDFPAVTVCNYNRFMSSAIQEKDKKHVKQLIQVYERTYAEFDFGDYLFGNLDDLYSDDSFDFEDFALKTGYSLKKSMHTCKWKGAKCGVKNFENFYSPHYGLCYTFTSRGNQTLPGIGNGLRLVLDIEENEYTETEQGNTEAGIKFAIHPHNEIPAMDTIGLSAAPGFHTFVSIRQTHHKNLHKPWGVCGINEAYQEPTNYSRNTCLSNCERDAIIDKCSCQPLGYLRLDEISLCNITQLKCTEKALVVHRGRAAEGTCTCPVSCDYFTYEPTISMARYPSISVLQSAMDSYGSRENASLYDEQYVTKSLVYLDVYYNELSTTTYDQVEDLPFTALLGELGGQLGLFLGASIITAVEFIDYLVRRIKRLLAKAKVGGNKVHCSTKDLSEAPQKS